jgi:hypothetical protein
MAHLPAPPSVGTGAGRQGFDADCTDGAPRAKPMVPKRRPQGANIPYQRTNSPTGRTRGPLGSG